MSDTFPKQSVSAESYRIAMTVTHMRIYNKTAYYVCPRCGRTLDREFVAYCDRCGQCLEWKYYRRAKVMR